MDELSPKMLPFDYHETELMRMDDDGCPNHPEPQVGDAEGLSGHEELPVAG
jgi:hypothetical protein